MIFGVQSFTCYSLLTVFKISIMFYFGQDLNNSGVVNWTSGNVFKIVCTVDVTYFPFDSLMCSVTIAGWPYTNDELLLYTSSSIDINFLSTISMWLYVSGTVSNSSNAYLAPSININITLT
jgi:hypothetical protein